MMGRDVWLVAAAAVVAALVVFAVWLTAVAARPHKPPSP
jgi:ABC-type transporter Mla subunit MlaD